MSQQKPTTRCPLTCPHGDQCTLDEGHVGGCNHVYCDCNDPNRKVERQRNGDD
jgi:hypothetical protein